MASRIASDIWSATLSGCPSETDSEVNSAYSAMLGSLIGWFEKLSQLNLKSVAQGEINALAFAQFRRLGPAGKILGLEALPEVATGSARPGLLVAAQVGDQQCTTGDEGGAQVFKDIRWRRRVVKNHVYHDAIGEHTMLLQARGVAQNVLDIAEFLVFRSC